MAPTTFSAVYQDGVFRPEVPPDLPEGTAVQLKIVPKIELDPRVPTSGQEILAIISKSWPKAKPGPIENVSGNVDAYLYGVKGDPGDVR